MGRNPVIVCMLLALALSAAIEVVGNRLVDAKPVLSIPEEDLDFPFLAIWGEEDFTKSDQAPNPSDLYEEALRELKDVEPGTCAGLPPFSPTPPRFFKWPENEAPGP